MNNMGNIYYFCKIMLSKAKPRIIAVIACWVMLVVLCACGGRGSVEDVSGNISTALCEIDSMMWRQPDSAFLRLLEFADSPEADSLSEFDGHYFQLLISELLYKNYCSQTNREPLLHAVEYFDSLENEKPFLDARAHYIKGVGYYETDSVVEACREYIKALEIMEEHFQKKDVFGKKAHFLSLTYNRLGDLFLGQFMTERAIVCLEHALIYWQVSPKSSSGESNILNQLGQLYFMQGEKEKAHDYFEKALEHISDHDNLIYRNILSAKALNEYELGMGMEQSMACLMNALSHAGDEEERLTRYLTIGHIYYKEGLFDSALKYLQPVFETNKDLLSAIQSAEYLKNIYQNKGDSEKTQQYTTFLSEHTVESVDNMILVAQLNELFNKHLSEQQLRETTKEKKRAVANTVRTMALVAFLGMIPLVLLIVWSKKRRKMLQEETVHLKEKETKTRQTLASERKSHTVAREAEKRRHEETLEAERKQHEEILETERKRHVEILEAERKQHEEILEAERQTHQMNQTTLSGRLKKSNQDVRQLTYKISQMQEHLLNIKEQAISETQAASFFDEPVCRAIKERVDKGMFKTNMDYHLYKDSALNKQELLSLRQSANHHYNHFTSKLKQRYPALKEKDLDYCCLYLLGLGDADISALIQCSYNAVVERRCKLERVFGCIESVSDFLMVFIHDR